jgi:hypothetical protein
MTLDELLQDVTALHALVTEKGYDPVGVEVVLFPSDEERCNAGAVCINWNTLPPDEGPVCEIDRG